MINITQSHRNRIERLFSVVAMDDKWITVKPNGEKVKAHRSKLTTKVESLPVWWQIQRREN